MSFTMSHFETPLGKIFLVARGGALCGVKFGPLNSGDRLRLEKQFGSDGWNGSPEGERFLRGVEKAFQNYFSGDAAALDGLAVDARGTEFQRRVWRSLRRIPAGKTRTYGEIARALGQPGAARAVGMANNRNPVPLVIPCHRVIASGGDLCGYGAGIQRKAWLLRHEGALAP